MSELTKEEIREKLGNIVQIRDLLLGDKIEEYDRSLAQTDKRLADLEARLANFQIEIGNRFMQMQKYFKEEIDNTKNSLEKKLKYLSLTTQEETSQLQQNLAIASQKSSQQLELIQSNTARQISFVSNELSQAREILTADLHMTKKQLLEALQEKLSEVQDAKVERSDLAEILFEICLKIKGSEFLPSLKEVANNHVKTDFILPENKQKHN
jgi:hypothetical protein